MKVTAPLLAVLWLIVPACSSNEDDGTPSPSLTGPVGGAAAGPSDAHCGTAVQTTSVYACGVSITGKSLGPQHEPDASVGDYGATMYGTQGSDDACKYDVTWSSTPIRKNVDVTFTINVTARTTRAPVMGAAPDAEVSLGDTHPAPNSNAATNETAAGQYTLGPIHFDEVGRWTVRFHFFEGCVDLTPDSPHGHAAFFVDVP